MTRLEAGFLVCAALTGVRAEQVRNLVANAEFRAIKEGVPEGWKREAPRPEIAAAGGVSKTPDGLALRLQGSGKASYGKWTTVVPGVAPGRFYSFEVLRRADNVANEEVSTGAILTWCKDEDGAKAVERDYVDRIAGAGGWRKEFRTFRAPEGARSVKVELFLRWTAGTVLWRNPRLTEVDARRPRIVRVATTHLVPGAPNTLESNTAAVRAMIDKVGQQKPDVVVLSENLVDRLLGQPLVKRAQPVPGPFTEMLSMQARKYKTYIATTLEELDGGAVYNAAVLIDREGRIAGKYRKTHLPLFEAEEGVTPGEEYPVFDTDFGRVGILTCWDSWFPEPARILRLKGAELLLLPIAGDGVPGHWDVISRARAIDNGVYVAASSTVADSSSRIIDPTGAVLGETMGPSGVVVREIDLDKQWRYPWLSVGPSAGEAKSLYIKERRPDTYGVFVQDGHERATGK